MNKLNLPKRLRDKLEKDQGLHGFVLSSIENLTPWLQDNKTVFFPEYTDHGLTHLNEVLLTSDSIISDDSWNNLTPADSAAMIIATLLHDCAMHLSEDGFYTLINDKFTEIRSRYVEKEVKWGALWLEFLAEAKRFDGKKLVSIFGDDNPVTDIPSTKLDLTGRDRLLIGEFIRRHHARVAHEIVFNGVPGSDGNTIKLGDASTEFLDLCGFIAKSHNMTLRNAVDRLEKHKQRVHHNTHVPFVMLVLRIADYIQIHSERAPKQLLNIKTLISPISRGEWKKHHSIVEINQAHDDPEALYIDAEPDDALSFNSLVSLFGDIQLELDISWSVIGEVYGRIPPLNELGITIRRIRSSLDDLDVYIKDKKPDFIPKVLKFRTADSEMMELLIAPLYGDNPAVGIRELMQNAVDACIELKDLIDKQQVILDEKKEFDVSVSVIEKDNNRAEVVIEDFGIGMSLDVVESYFLNIGASFRNSDRWKKDHETDGCSNVYRTGRFGIGLLAAYLLGDEINVITRNVHEKVDKGLKFSCKKGSDSIEVSNIDAHIGTKISILVSETVKDQLIRSPEMWDWFSLDEPKVIRKIITNKENNLEQALHVPNSDTSLVNTNYHRIIVDGYDDVYWTYDEITKKSYRYRNESTLICNGIYITNDMKLERVGVSEPVRWIEIYSPSIVVFDQDGRLPINLERNNLISKSLPFMDVLYKDLSTYIVNEMINVYQDIDISLSAKLLSKLVKVPVTGFVDENYSTASSAGKFIVCEKGLLPVDLDLMAESKIDSIFIDAANLSLGRGAWTSEEFRKICSNYLVVNDVTDTKGSRTSWVRSYFELRNTNYHSFGFTEVPIVGRRILIKKNDVTDVLTPGYVPKTFWNRTKTEWEDDKWVMLSIGRVPNFKGDLDKICSELDETSSFGFVVGYLDWEMRSKRNNDSGLSLFADAWLKKNSYPILQVN